MKQNVFVIHHRFSRNSFLTLSECRIYRQNFFRLLSNLVEIAEKNGCNATSQKLKYLDLDHLWTLYKLFESIEND